MAAPYYRDTGPQQAREPRAPYRVRMEAGRIGGGGSRTRSRPMAACGSEENERMKPDAGKESKGWQQPGRCPGPRQGASPLRPRPPFPGGWIVRSASVLSRVRKPRTTRAPLTKRRRSEEFAVKRERGPLCSGPSGCLPLVGCGICLPLQGCGALRAHEALPHASPGGKPPETPECYWHGQSRRCRQPGRRPGPRQGASPLRPPNCG